MDRYAEAEPLLQRALAIEKEALGADHPVYAMKLEPPSDPICRYWAPRERGELALQGVEAHWRSLIQNLPALSGPEKQQLLTAQGVRLATRLLWTLAFDDRAQSESGLSRRANDEAVGARIGSTGERRFASRLAAAEPSGGIASTSASSSVGNTRRSCYRMRPMKAAWAATKVPLRIPATSGSSALALRNSSKSSGARIRRTRSSHGSRLSSSMTSGTRFGRQTRSSSTCDIRDMIPSREDGENGAMGRSCYGTTACGGCRLGRAQGD